MAVQNHFHTYLERDAAELIVTRPHDRVERAGILFILDAEVHVPARRALELGDLADDPRGLRFKKYIKNLYILGDREHLVFRHA